MPIDPDIYEKYSGRRMGEAQERLGQALASNEARKAANKEKLARPRVPLFLGGQGLLIRLLLEAGWPGLLVLVVIMIVSFLLVAVR